MGSFDNGNRVVPPTEAGTVDAGTVEVGTVEVGASTGVDPHSVDSDLAALSDLPLAERAAVFERLHNRLQSALSAIDA